LCLYIFIYMVAHGDPEASWWIRDGFGIAREQRGLFKIARICEGMSHALTFRLVLNNCALTIIFFL
jgi:hypothetical protein